MNMGNLFFSVFPLNMMYMSLMSCVIFHFVRIIRDIIQNHLLQASNYGALEFLCKLQMMLSYVKLCFSVTADSLPCCNGETNLS